jgi:rod shape-determining protein MreC
VRKNSSQLAPFLWLALVLAAWWVVPTCVRRGCRDAVFYEFQAPAQSTVSHLRDLQTYWEKRTRSNSDLVEVAVEQARSIAWLNAENARLRSLENENKRLREMFNMHIDDNYRGIVARVVRRDINSWWKQITLRRGARDGVRNGSPVVAGGFAVGRVTRVHLDSCEVQLISDPDFRASVNVDGSESHAAVYQGIAGRPFDPPRGVITHLSADYQYEPAMKGGVDVNVYTSGSGGVFPPALIIGKIAGTLVTTDAGLFKTGDVILHQQLYSLDEATILLPLDDFTGEASFNR